MTHKLAILGSGPAGYTAAIYTARAFVDTTIYAGMQPGGQLTLTTEVENFPGFPEGIMGPQLMENMQKQAERFGTKVLQKSVTKLEQSGKQFKVYDNYGGSAIFDAVIIASGASARYLGIAGEEKYFGKGYHSCATCDGFFYRDKDVLVVGGGDSAMEESNFLSKFARSVTIVHRSDKFRASPIMLKRSQDNPKIHFIMNAEISALHGEDKLTSVTLNSTNNQPLKLGQNIANEAHLVQKDIETNALFVAIGHTPNTDFAKGFLTMDELGYLLPEHNTMSNIEGIFVAGDVADRHYRQAITAAGEGCKASLDVEKYLTSLT